MADRCLDEWKNAEERTGERIKQQPIKANSQTKVRTKNSVLVL